MQYPRATNLANHTAAQECGHFARLAVLHLNLIVAFISHPSPVCDNTHPVQQPGLALVLKTDLHASGALQVIKSALVRGSSLVPERLLDLLPESHWLLSTVALGILAGHHQVHYILTVSKYN